MNVVPADTWKVAPVETLIRLNLVNAVLPDILSDSILIDVPEPIVNAYVVLNIRFSSVPCVLPSAVENPLTPVRFAPSP